MELLTWGGVINLGDELSTCRISYLPVELVDLGLVYQLLLQNELLKCLHQSPLQTNLNHLQMLARIRINFSYINVQCTLMYLLNTYSAFLLPVPVLLLMHHLQAGSLGKQARLAQGLSNRQDSSQYSHLIAYWEGLAGQSIKLRN